MKNPDSIIAKGFVFIYSMETFLYSNLNRAEREKDGSKIKTLGPFAFVLGFISYLA